jgi:CRP-like cAMP-binding protein
LSMAMFIVSYAKSTARTAQAQRQRSRVVRLREARRLLDQRGKILTLELNGAIFFGSSVTTLEHIKSLLGVAPSSPRVAGAGAGAKAVGKGAKAAGGAAATGAYRPSRTHSRRVPGEEGRNGGGGSKTFRSVKSVVGMWWKRLRQSIIQGVDEEEWREEDTDEDEEKAGELRPLRPLPPAEDAARLGALLAVPAASNSSSSTYGALRPPSHQRQRSDSSAQPRRPHTHKPRFLILDFRRVSAIDMSSVVNCFLPLQTLCKDMGVVLCYSNCNVRVEFYLRANRLLEDTNTRLFPTLHQALDSCETALLGEESVHTQGHSVRARAFSLRGVQELSVVSVLRTMLFEEEEEEEEGKEEEEEEEGEGGQATARSINEAALETIAHYAREERYQDQETIFYKGDPSDSFYLILAGEVALEAADDGDEDGLEDDALLDVHLRGVERPEEGDGRQRHVEVVLHSGSLFGFVDFFLENQRRRFFARAMTPVKLGVFSQTALRRLEAENPRLMVLVQKLLLKQFSIELGNVSAL